MTTSSSGVNRLTEIGSSSGGYNVISPSGLDEPLETMKDCREALGAHAACFRRDGRIEAGT
jgi:hypothetical protein